jgi:hypothetical protein
VPKLKGLKLATVCCGIQQYDTVKIVVFVLLAVLAIMKFHFRGLVVYFPVISSSFCYWRVSSQISVTPSGFKLLTLVGAN